jgi:formate hydrogenlyase subunit 6/NADH:ubiquinone oxidoreductase subunit I
MNNIQTEDKSLCCGCSLCSILCPQKAIKMVNDNKGFQYPLVDQKLCIDCGICVKHCPILLQKKKTKN